jgi:transcriptional regulator with XRE-family HTH domain
MRIAMTVSEQLKKAILSSKKTKYAIAVGSGIDHAVLRRFLKGERDIKLKTADQLATFLGLDLTKKKHTESKK